MQLPGSRFRFGKLELGVVVAVSFVVENAAQFFTDPGDCLLIQQRWTDPVSSVPIIPNVLLFHIRGHDSHRHFPFIKIDSNFTVIIKVLQTRKEKMG